MIVRPFGSALRSLPHIKQQLETRRRKLLDFDVYREKLDAELSKNPDGEQAAKLQQKLDNARMRVGTITEEIRSKCLEMEGDTLRMIEEGAATFIAVQAMASGKGGKKFDPIVREVPQAAKAMCMLCTKTEELELNLISSKR